MGRKNVNMCKYGFVSARYCKVTFIVLQNTNFVVNK
jgi:hypothetical protein